MVWKVGLLPAGTPLVPSRPEWDRLPCPRGRLMPSFLPEPSPAKDPSRAGRVRKAACSQPPSRSGAGRGARAAGAGLSGAPRPPPALRRSGAPLCENTRKVSGGFGSGGSAPRRGGGSPLGFCSVAEEGSGGRARRARWEAAAARGGRGPSGCPKVCSPSEQEGGPERPSAPEPLLLPLRSQPRRGSRQPSERRGDRLAVPGRTASRTDAMPRASVSSRAPRPKSGRPIKGARSAAGDVAAARQAGNGAGSSARSPAASYRGAVLRPGTARAFCVGGFGFRFGFCLVFLFFALQDFFFSFCFLVCV